MTSMALDKSLDDIIASRPKTSRRAPRRGAKAQVVGTPAAQAARARYSAPLPASNGAVAQATTAAPQSSEKIMVSNLPIDVNEAQIRELFSSTVGPLREVNLHFDNAGRSKGVASVLFSRKGDGTKAFNQYNNRLIDGKRPMKIEIVVDPSRPVPQALLARVGPPPASAAANVAPMEGVQAASTRGGRGRSRGGRGRGARGGAKKSERPAKSAADLDAEMEDYTTQPTAAAAAAAPAA